jgi:DNA-binding protein HU-beta
MTEKIEQKEFIKSLAKKMKTDEETAALWLDTILDLITDCIKKGLSLTLKNFGRFYIRQKRDGTIFKFLPSQKLKYYLGWSSTYKE